MRYELGRRISAARREHRMTQDELAALLNVSRQSISHWEQGISTPDFEVLCSLIQILDMDISDLFSISRDPSQTSCSGGKNE